MFEVTYLPSFQTDLDAIVDYITYTLEAPHAAANLLDDLESAISRLKEFPHAHRLYRPLMPIPAQYRVLTVHNYLVFYTVDANTVDIHRIIYKKRNLSQLIR
ncbi:MAG: type II toxin-antitoxin system RelE/ParE family toxin [Spirochaetaceae bacterium]|jgi:addiction module RelE/StbE family toxin|nr:type II toxin-antitoxin system RelE/ParE family toxin [Spirochaetaceae bacterium]